MKRFNKNKQGGVVLVFSLLILLLITLVGVNMVQQNRLQFMMAANSQMQTTSFIDTEDVLELAEYFIARQRYIAQPVPPATEKTKLPPPLGKGTVYACNKTASGKFDQIKPHRLNGDELQATGAWAGVGLGLSDDIIARSNPVVEVTQTACMNIGNTEILCTPDSNTVSGWDAAEMQCYQSDQAQCLTEIYTLNIELTDPSGSQHVVQSRFAVRCDS